MARQARSHATRKRILDAAVELFTEAGYANTGLGDIIERAELTKGALYYHFDSKESLATAIIHESSTALHEAARGIEESPAPALENLIHLSFVIAEMVAGDALIRTGSQLMRALGEFSEVAVQTYAGLGGLIVDAVRRAGTEGDLRAGVDPDAAGELLVSAYLGIELLSIGASDGHDIRDRLHRMWQVVLLAIADPDAVPYLLEFAEREADRRP